jgi:hypothetical protein
MATNDNVFKNFDDRPLLDAAKRLATDERRATAALLRALMEIDSRRLYLGEGCASMFAYGTQVLRLAEGAAYNRIEAARAARSYPVILDLFEQSAITLTAVRLLAPHLTADNHLAVLAAARHKSKREIEALVAAVSPKPDVAQVVRKLPAVPTAPTVPLSPALNTPSVFTSGPDSASATTAGSAAPPPRVEPRAVFTPLAPERYRIQLTVPRETHDKFRRAQALLRHAVPSGDAAEIFDRALTLLLENLERRRFAETSRPRTPMAPAACSRHIPAAVRRAVWRRDGGRCAFVGASGRCRETAFLEFHHVEPYAAGGAATLENTELRCRAHNVYEARLFFGESVVRESRPQWGIGALSNSHLSPETAAIDALNVTRVAYSTT